VKKNRLSSLIFAFIILILCVVIFLNTQFVLTPSPILPYYEVQLVRPAPSINNCEKRVYDKNGRSYLKIDYLILGYEGEAPLYVLSPTQLKLSKNVAGCYDFPSNVEPIQAVSGSPIFPVKITVISNKENLTTYKGESIRLTVIAEIQSKFDEVIWPLEIRPGQLKALKFAVTAPSFDIDNKGHTDQISLNKSASTGWTLFPKSTADGIQDVDFTIDGEAFNAKEKAVVTILNNRFGLGPLIVIFAVAMITLLAFVISQWENITKIFNAAKEAINNSFSQKTTPTENSQDKPNEDENNIEE